MVPPHWALWRKININKNSIGIVVSQSGETMDTLKCISKFKEYGIPTISIVNVLNSSIARLSDFILPTIAGPEIGVASTKAFIGQMLVLYILSIKISEIRKDMDIKTYYENIFLEQGKPITYTEFRLV